MLAERDPLTDARGADNEVLVSVVVPVRDEAGAVAQLIERLAAQTLERRRFEVIVADDGSTDGLAERLKTDGRWLRITRAARCNSYAARNRAARLARAPFLAFTDADCLPRENWLEAGIASLRSADLVAGCVELLAPERPTAWTIIDATLFDQERFVEMGNAATANLFMTAALFDRQDGFDDALPSGGDWEFVRRSVGAGARLIFAPQAVVQHRTRDTATEFLRRRWRIEHAFARRATRAGRSLRALNKGREPVVPRRWGFAVGYDTDRMAAVGLSSGWGARLKTAPARYVFVPAVDGLAQATGWLRSLRARWRW